MSGVGTPVVTPITTGAMTLADLREQFHLLTDDKADPPLWSDAEITRYANEAVDDAVERGFLIEDDTTPAICQIAIVAGTATYALDARILKIARMSLGSKHQRIVQTDADTLSRTWRGFGWSRGWENWSGFDRAYIETSAGIRLIGIPTANDTLYLAVYRLPLADMVEDTDEPEIRSERRYDLLDGMLARAYLKHDSETYHEKLSAEHEARFTANFGAKVDANVRKKQRAPRSNVTRFIW